MISLFKNFIHRDCIKRIEHGNSVYDNKKDKALFTFSYYEGIYAARRIAKCKCPEKAAALESRNLMLILDYALCLTVGHTCDYKDYACEHAPSAIECYECFKEDASVVELVEKLVA